MPYRLVVQAAPLAQALLELLPGMGSNAMIAQRILHLMAAAGACMVLHAFALTTMATQCFVQRPQQA
jgi:hypothetical protein